MEIFQQDGVRGVLHRAGRPNGKTLALTHGAGSNADAPLLVHVAAALADAGYLVLRYDLPFRQRRPTGPPGPGGGPDVAAHDREGIARAVEALRGLGCGSVVAGGHSYGGRQTAMAAAEGLMSVDGLVLLSYPLHPPRRPEQKRTAFFPKWRTPALFVHGSRDPFGSVEEMREALKLIPAPTELVTIQGAGHDLKAGVGLAAEALERFLARVCYPE